MKNIPDYIKKDLDLLERTIVHFEKGGILTHIGNKYEGKINKGLLRKYKEKQFNKDFKDIKILIDKVYTRFSEDIDKIHSKYMKNNQYANPEQDNTVQFKVGIAMEHLIFQKDKRSLKEVIQSLFRGWDNENELMSEIRKAGFKVEFNGGDKDRIISFFQFNASPDLLINGFLVEYQTGLLPFFKKNKLERNIQLDSYILFYDIELGYHLFDIVELKDLFNNKGNSIRYGKPGRMFNKEDYTWYNDVKEALSELREDF